MLTVIKDNTVPQRGKHWSLEDIVRIRIVIRPAEELTERIKVIIKFTSAIDSDNIPLIKGKLADRRVVIFPRKISGNVFEGIVLPWKINFFDEDQHEQITAELIAAIDPKQKRQIAFSLIIDQNITFFTLLTLTDLEYQKDHPHLRVIV